MSQMIYTDDYDYERYSVFEVNHPKILKDIAQNLDMRYFDVDENGYGYYGMFVDRMMGAIVVVTKNVNDAPIRMVFDGNEDNILHIEGDGKVMEFDLKNGEMTLNQCLRKHFNVPHAVDPGDKTVDQFTAYTGRTRCRWVRTVTDRDILL